MATLTGQRIKDTYDAVLKLEDNAALTSSPKAITDGLGNNTPISVSTIKVDVSSDLEASSFVKTSGLSTQFLKADGSVDSSAYLTSGDLPASHWSSNLVGIDYAGGNVGIGTTSPSAKLHIEASDPRIKIVDADGTNWQSEVFTQGGSLKLQARNGTNFGNISFQGDNGTTQSEYARFNSVGNLGIGTTSPSEKLHVEGDIRLLDELIFGEYSTTTDRLTNQSYALTMAHSTALNFKVGTASVFNVYGTQIRPQINNTVDFGHSGFRWKRGYFAGNLIANSIGIGTDYPSDELTIEAESPTIRLKDISSSNYAEFYVNNFDTYLDSAGRTFIQSGGSTNVTVTSSGNVGIGTTSPSEKLEVVGGIKLSDNSPLTWATSNTRIFGQVGYMQFQVGSTDKMRITSAGNVGIGTTAPSTPLHISADAPTIRLQDATSGDNHYLTGNNGELRVQSSGYITMRPGAAVSTTFLANGNVGIGTTSPSAKLQIDSTSGWGVFTERGIKDGSTSTYSHNYGAGNAHILGRAMYFENSAVFSTSTADSTTKEYRFSNASDKLTVKSLVSGVTVDNNILVLSGSNVGIGTASPLNKLQVSDGSVGIDSQYMIRDNRNNTILHQSANTAASNRSLTIGNATYSNVIIPNGNVGIGTTSPSRTLSVKSSSSSMVADFRSASGNNSFVSFSNNASTADQVRLGSTSGNLVLSTNYTERIRIDASGNVGIGTTSPLSRLHVVSREINNGANKGIRIENYNGTKDYSIRTGVSGIENTSLAFYDETAGANRIVITSAGNVGIGTDSPSEKLEVDGQVLSDGYRLAAMQTAPATRNSTGTLGEIVIDGNYIYVCYAANSWSRVALETSW